MLNETFFSLKPAWWNLAGLQQMELLSRLQGGLGGSGGAGAAAAAAAGLGGFGGLHPEHLMNLEILQAQHGQCCMNLFCVIAESLVTFLCKEMQDLMNCIIKTLLACMFPNGALSSFL